VSRKSKHVEAPGRDMLENRKNIGARSLGKEFRIEGELLNLWLQVKQ
jgi:hypothetical protein